MPAKDIFKNLKMSESCEMVSLLIIFWSVCTGEWKYVHSKGNKGTCLNSSGLNVMCSPLCGDCGVLQHTWLPQHSYCPPDPLNSQCRLFFSELKIKLAMLQ